MNSNEINDFAPTSIRHLIGQKGVIDQVAVALDAAQMDGKKFDHSLLVGPPGLGKSALANIIANDMAVDLHEVLGQAIKTPADLHLRTVCRHRRSHHPRLCRHRYRD